MNWDQIEGNWKQVKGRAKEQWGELTDDELDKAEGRPLFVCLHVFFISLAFSLPSVSLFPASFLSSVALSEAWSLVSIADCFTSSALCLMVSAMESIFSSMSTLSFPLGGAILMICFQLDLCAISSFLKGFHGLPFLNFCSVLNFQILNSEKIILKTLFTDRHS